MTKEKVVLVLASTERGGQELEPHIMAELEGLVDSAGGEVVARFTQYKSSIDPKWIVGEGKLEEIRQSVLDTNADLVIFHNTLSGSQQRNIEHQLEIRVIDRTRLILDVFALRARSQEGKLQVELAQLLYQLPRLTGQYTSLSRLGGGIGTRGPGETKLETDRRVIKKKIIQLRDKLDTVSKVRHIHRQGRERRSAPVLALVGYTSAGKSTLFSKLSGEETDISANLFSTLDPLIRRVDLGRFLAGAHGLVSDTVGFIRDMPKEVMSAFKATLEEILEADLILLVLDISHPDHQQHRQAVEAVLNEIKNEDQAVWTVYNKIDLVNDPMMLPGDGHLVSARTGEGLEALLEGFFRFWAQNKGRYVIKFSRSEHRYAEKLDEWSMILRRWYEGDRFCVEIVVPRVLIEPFLQKTKVEHEELAISTGKDSEPVYGSGT